MFGGKKKIATYDGIETVIGPRVIIKGGLRSNGSVRLDGEIDGRLEVKGDLVIGDKGAVRGEVIVANVLIAGDVEGNISSQGRIEITPTGKVKGDVQSKVFVVEEGGFFMGNCKMDWPEAQGKRDESRPNISRKTDNHPPQTRDQ